MENSWTKPQTEVLISILERYPVLYKCAHKDFSKSYVKEKAYRDIVAQFVDVKPDVTINSLKRKIKTLRSQMWAEERKRLSRRKGNKDIYQPKLWCYKQLQFLLNSNEDYLDEDEDILEEDEEEADAKSAKDYIDIDQTVLEPSPQRIRNILTLEERVAAIEAYDCRPMYTKVAKMFNCSWEQIKNIIANRDAIMEFYMATRNAETQNDTNRVEVRSRKISFLGECLYEYIQRAQFHTKAHITEDLLRMKAIEFREMIQIDNFMPNKTWINHFKATYNFSLSNRQITITRTPPMSLDLKDIMTYCTKNKAKVSTANQVLSGLESRESDLYRTTTRIAISGENEAALQEMKQRRLRKINFLKKTLFEYWQRASHHHKMRMNENSLRKVAFELKEMLKIDNFYPSKEWLNNYITVTYPTMLSQTDDTRPPPLSLDLKDILSFCSRQENKKQAPSTITLAPKEATQQQQVSRTATTTPPVTAPLVQIHTFNLHRNDDVGAHERMPYPTAIAKTTATATTTTTRTLPTKIKEEVIDLDADEEEQDIKPNVHELVPPPETPEAAGGETKITATKATINTIALINEKQQQKVNLNAENCSSIQQLPALRVVSLSTLVPPPLAPLPAGTLPTITLPTASQQISSPVATQAAALLETAINSRKRPSVEIDFPHQPLKIHKIESIGAQIIDKPIPSPGHWSEHSDPEEEELPRHVKNYKDALKLLKPLEEFAMLEENYRVIGLISQLEDIFKHPPHKDDT
uniref:HTH CENPB-type domain-containing protein n=1 Tax=Ceratitis capitata TaxID=7213 RepID=W8ARK6_CERCA